MLGNPRRRRHHPRRHHRDERRRLQEVFRQNNDVRVLVATDAAGEGVNLQNANLMVNYDLPWNPNRLEQRFGRIHRIGQREVCHLWNLVAKETREGDVFQRLFEKLEVERKAPWAARLRHAGRGVRRAVAEGPADPGDPLRRAAGVAREAVPGHRQQLWTATIEAILERNALVEMA